MKAEDISKYVTVEDRGYKTPCHIWQRGKYRSGYGQATIGKKKTYSHIAAWEFLHGPVPPGLQLDHLCRVLDCCNAEHLEPVTPLENLKRSNNPNMITHRTGVCRRGHKIEGDNVILIGKSKHCKICARMNNKNWINKRQSTYDPTREGAKHGTKTEYTYGCRCDLCSKTHAEAGRKWRAERKNKNT